MLADPDIQLMLRFKGGDTHAFQTLFNKHKQRVLNYCYRYCGNHMVAEELTQETFIRVFKAASRYVPKAKFSTWLFKIATNVCLNELRKPVYRHKIESFDTKANNEAREIPDANQPGMDVEIESSETRRLLQEAILKLPEKQRAALLLKIDRDFSYKEIGKQIQRSENNVKILIHRARQRLKELLD